MFNFRKKDFRSKLYILANCGWVNFFEINAIYFYLLKKKKRARFQKKVHKRLNKNLNSLQYRMYNWFLLIGLYISDKIISSVVFLIFFTKKYIYTINHKRIALNYLYLSFITGLSGLSLATIIRLELSTPGSYFFYGDSIKYLQVITLHALIMIFFVAIPLLFGFIANFLIPYHIGSKDVAFPRLNSIAFWLQILSYTMVSRLVFLRTTIIEAKLVRVDLNSFKANFTPSDHISGSFNLKAAVGDPFLPLDKFKEVCVATSGQFFESPGLEEKTLTYVNELNHSYTLPGWTFITPLSSNLQYTTSGPTDVAAIAIILAGVGSTISFTNLLITRRTMSMPGLQSRKTPLPFITINLFLCMRMLALITPVLASGLLMVFLDRNFNTSFFDYSYGGDVILFHHLFWFFGHPEVYVLLIPCFGIVSSLLPHLTGKRIPSKNHMIWATYVMGYMGFLVWGHHMYLVGLDHRSRALYSTITIMISLPAVVKIVNWSFAFFNSRIKFTVSLLFILAFLLFFLGGGLTGMWLSHVNLNLYFHDTFYVVAHFHLLFSSCLFSALFAFIYFYHLVIFNVQYNHILANLHFWFFFSGQWLTFLPLFLVGYNGLPRRYHDYPGLYAGYQGLSTSGHILTLLSVIFFFCNLISAFFFTQRQVFVPANKLNNRISLYLSN